MKRTHVKIKNEKTDELALPNKPNLETLFESEITTLLFLIRLPFISSFKGRKPERNLKFSINWFNFRITTTGIKSIYFGS